MAYETIYHVAILPKAYLYVKNTESRGYVLEVRIISRSRRVNRYDFSSIPRWKIVLGALSALFFFIAMIVLIRSWESRGWKTVNAGQELFADGNYDLNDSRMQYYHGMWYHPKANLETTLILGLDKFIDTPVGTDAVNYEQSDFLLLLTVDRDAKTCSALQINRDTMTDIWVVTSKGYKIRQFFGQITLAHTYGDSRIGCYNSIEAVKTLLGGVEIDHYISVTMDGVQILNDAVGGVTVEVLDDFTGVDETLVKGQTVTLRGEHALNYVRARRGMVEDPTNLNRMQRQRQYLEALEEQFLKNASSDDSFTGSVLWDLNRYLVSDCTIEQLSDLINSVTSYEMGEIQQLPGEAVQGEIYMEYYVDEPAVREIVIDQFYEPIVEGT